MLIRLSWYVEDFSEEDEPIDDPTFEETHKQWIDEVLKDPMTFEVRLFRFVLGGYF